MLPIVVNLAKKAVLDKVLHRKKKAGWKRQEVDIGGLLKTILLRANEFVPSESGSILLDDPLLKFDQFQNEGRLYFIACFGKGSSNIVGTSLPDNVGIVGQTYTSGKPYISKDVASDTHFYSAIDKKTKFISRSIICVPIEIEGAKIGVIELINRKERINYDRKDLTLLKIFAGYTSTLIQNTLDAAMFKKLSGLDNLTGLHNDRFFFEAIEKELSKAVERGKDVSLIFFDLDHFKKVNDTYGHLVGSRVLKEVGGLMEEVFNKANTILTRYGGDEFVIILPEADLRIAGEYAEAIRRKIKNSVFIKEADSIKEKALNIKGIITASVGVASLKGNIMLRKNITRMGTALIGQADKAMYQAKELGKNKVCFAEGKV